MRLAHPMQLTDRSLDKESFNRRVLTPLKHASNSGDATNAVGTRLIGHAPHIAPEAYVHVVYSPLGEAHLQELRVRLGRPLPPEYEDFLKNANGLMMFLGQIRVFGYVPLKRQAADRVHNYPSSVIVPNVSARVVGLSHGAVAVGWYKANGSYAAIEDDGTVTQFAPKARAVVLRRYQEDLDPLEIARTLEMPVNTVKSHLKRSLASLRERIAPTASSALEALGYE